MHGESTGKTNQQKVGTKRKSLSSLGSHLSKHSVVESSNGTNNGTDTMFDLPSAADADRVQVSDVNSSQAVSIYDTTRTCNPKTSKINVHVDGNFQSLNTSMPFQSALDPSLPQTEVEVCKMISSQSEVLRRLHDQLNLICSRKQNPGGAHPGNENQQKVVINPQFLPHYMKQQVSGVMHPGVQVHSRGTSQNNQAQAPITKVPHQQQGYNVYHAPIQYVSNQNDMSKLNSSINHQHQQHPVHTYFEPQQQLRMNSYAVQQPSKNENHNVHYTAAPSQYVPPRQQIGGAPHHLVHIGSSNMTSGEQPKPHILNRSQHSNTGGQNISTVAALHCNYL